MKKILTFILFFIFHFALCAQNNATVFGTVTEGGTNTPIEFAIVFIKDLNRSVETNAAGEYSIKVPAGRAVLLQVQRVGYKEGKVTIEAMRAETQRRIDFTLVNATSQQEVIVKDTRLKDNGLIREDVKDFRLLPTTTGNLEAVLPHIALGTNSGSGGELTSQYQVRGGNYDENLVYVNDFEIYRPQLIRAGQQEGLTFANADLMRDLSFSSGGFEARYGDKMSSVLDIKYKRPDSFRISAAGSLLGGSAHVEGSKKLGGTVAKDSFGDGYRRFRYLVGARYKTTRYILGSLDLKGEYVPNFADIQAYLTYDLNRAWQIGVLANYNESVYNFVPRSRESAFGLINFTLGVRTAFEGQERDRFTNGMAGVSLTYLPDRKKNPFFLKFLASRFQTREVEGIDIIGDYLIGEIETNPNKDNAGDIVSTLGTGTQHQFVRNTLWGAVTNVEHKGGYEIQLATSTPSPEESSRTVTKTSFLQWGIKYQSEQIEDKINEWERLDSALYSLPFDTTKLVVKNVYKTQNSLTSNRFSSFVQNTYTWRKDSVGEFQATLGVRAAYWDLNKEAFVTPRLQMAYKPLNWEKDISFRLSGGLYYQPPFYRELRRPNGTVNKDVLAQKSAQVVTGLTYDFSIGSLRRIPFRLISEIYYKKLWDVVTYDVDNVRIRYAGENNATGYIMGWDTRINGEFVPGAESWINLSFLRARESLDSVQHRAREVGDPTGKEVADVPRPTDQLMTLSVFFQDYLPKNKNFKMHLNTTIGTGLPFGFPGNNIVYRNTYRLKPYHRVDLGFSVLMYDESWKNRKPRHTLRFTRQTWASLEIFNLMAVANEASKTWIKTIYNTQFAIPNYLTSRRINLRVRMDF
ncbi:MAG: carboxypeptidase-like regulatory domain-containing protein [Saprospiraceae bacterium]|nr:carboxypeptidase-like regulatory domain-containing protein [Saprospiraceae bacterium]